MTQTNKKIQEYWDDRAKTAKLNPNATTDDVYVRELEIRTFVESIKKIKKKNLKILDLGCGDGFTTIGVAEGLKAHKFLGVDYSPNMIENAKRRLKKSNPTINLEFKVADATKLMEVFEPESFDVIISSRCLINLITSKQQYKTINDIYTILKKDGQYISIENFEDGNRELNNVRKTMGLEEIPVRWHNLFFKEKEYFKNTLKKFKEVKISNFSSAYYYATRVIYSKFCQMKGIKPDYKNEIHQLAVNLPPFGNYSPIKLVIHKK